jgi:phosphoglycolate phosphatase-like HAD superfamily hydrolase
VRRLLLGLQAVVFDLDGTLLDRRLSFELFMRDQWKRFSRELQSVDEADYVRTLIELDRNGYAPRNEMFAGTVARAGLPSGLAETLLRDYGALRTSTGKRPVIPSNGRVGQRHDGELVRGVDEPFVSVGRS